MIIAISGKAGAGKSTIAKELSEKLKLRYYSIGSLMREMANKKGVSLIELGKLAEENKKIDMELDNKQKQLAKKEKNFIIDSRLSAYFVPNADIKIFLDCDDKIRSKRVLQEQRKDEKSSNIMQATENIKIREESERLRYKKYYNVDYHNPELYNLIIDTSFLKVNEITEKIIRFIGKTKNDKIRKN